MTRIDDDEDCDSLVSDRLRHPGTVGSMLSVARNSRINVAWGHLAPLVMRTRAEKILHSLDLASRCTASGIHSLMRGFLWSLDFESAQCSLKSRGVQVFSG